MLSELDVHKYLLTKGYERGKFKRWFEDIEGFEEWAEQLKDRPRRMHEWSLGVYVFPNAVRERHYGKYPKPSHLVVIESFNIEEFFVDPIGASYGEVQHLNNAFFYHINEDKTPELMHVKPCEFLCDSVIEETNMFFIQPPERVALDFPETRNAVRNWCREHDFYFDEPGPSTALYERYYSRTLRDLAAGKPKKYTEGRMREILYRLNRRAASKQPKTTLESELISIFA